MSEDKESLEIVIEFDTVYHPIYLRGFQRQMLLDTLDIMRIPYTLSMLHRFGDGQSRITPEDYTP